MTYWRLTRIVLLVLLAAAILVLSLLPQPPLTPRWFAGLDKVQHWIAYGVLSFLVYITIQSPKEQRVLYFALTVFVCTMYGGLIEVLQSFTGRKPDVVDFFVNMFGAVTGSILGVGLIEITRSRKPR